ncbi:hypothetical protein ATO12_00460 [Aquimarina atlantica]|uniref:DoxX family protein n=1 Tax=Aquimarina atlantica TaxID=1317122 RepID=A0A023BYY7_9FLAO|nr:DoxX family protein [Aquimarina atlantica]EZH75281.1 hypothetical protein ATO12_00460 [Aquimarina atlantica]
MNTLIWILQGLIAFVFMFSGINKTYFDEKTLVQKGQTGVEGLNKWFIKFIGTCEILGSVALILPLLINKWVILTPIAAICLGFIMIPAAYIHKKRKEPKNVIVNIAILIVCTIIIYFRM